MVDTISQMQIDYQVAKLAEEENKKRAAQGLPPLGAGNVPANAQTGGQIVQSGTPAASGDRRLLSVGLDSGGGGGGGPVPPVGTGQRPDNMPADRGGGFENSGGGGAIPSDPSTIQNPTPTEQAAAAAAQATDQTMPPPTGTAPNDGIPGGYTDQGGWSQNFPSVAWEDLQSDPNLMFDLMLQQQGIDPYTNNPLTAANRRKAARAKTVFDLTHRLGSGQGVEPLPDAMLDWFETYMNSDQVLTGEQGKALINQALQAAQSGDTFWGGRVGSIPFDKNYGVDTQISPEDQATLVKELVAGALGGAVDPVFLSAVLESVDRAASNYALNVYGGKNAQNPVNEGEDWFSWLQRTGALPAGLGRGGA